MGHQLLKNNFSVLNSKIKLSILSTKHLKFKYSSFFFRMSVPRMSNLLSSGKCKTANTQQDSFQSITNDVTSFLEKTEAMLAGIKLEEKSSFFFNYKGISDVNMMVSSMDFVTGSLGAVTGGK